ncbi:MAG: four helix bundle protein [Nitrospirota bacterium]
MHNSRKLNVYQRAIDFAVLIYKLSKSFPNDEVFGSVSQIRRAATSISPNIAEGSGNKSNKEFRRFIEIALRSNYEVMTCLEIALRLHYCKKEDFEKLITEADEIAAMLVGFAKQL